MARLANGAPLSLRMARGSPVLEKHRLQHPAYLHEVAGIDGLAAQRVAAGIVDQGQRIDATAIAAQEPALEVDRDDIVGLFGVCQRFAVRRCAAAFLGWPGEPFVMQDLADRRGCGRVLERLLALEHGADLLRAPQRMLAADLQNAGDHLGRDLLGMMVRGAGEVGETGGALALVALDPFVADAALNAVAAAQLGLRLQTGFPIQDELHTLIYGVCFFPRHKNIVASQCFP